MTDLDLEGRRPLYSYSEIKELLEAEKIWWAERFFIMHRSDPEGRTAYLEMQQRAQDVQASLFLPQDTE